MKSRDIQYYLLNAFFFNAMLLAYSAEVILAEWIFVTIVFLELFVAIFILLTNPIELIDEINKLHKKVFEPVANTVVVIYLVWVGAITPLVMYFVAIQIETYIRESRMERAETEK